MTVKPVCSPAVRPVLTVVDPSALDSVDDQTYKALSDNERRLQNWGIANEKIILEVCEK